MDIYVVVHACYSDENVFFTSFEKAQQSIDKRIAEPVSKDFTNVRDCWRIVRLKEGERFEADELPDTDISRR